MLNQCKTLTILRTKNQQLAPKITVHLGKNVSLFCKNDEAFFTSKILIYIYTYDMHMRFYLTENMVYIKKHIKKQILLQ